MNSLDDDTFSYVLNPNNVLEDDVMRAFHEKLSRHTSFRPREVGVFGFPELIEPVPPNESYLQIIYDGDTVPFKWKESGARIMDIGCGDGSVTMEVWKKYMPKSFMKIVGSDKNQSCVDFASENYGSEHAQFIRLDIEEEISEELKGSFDHVISSYTFHWVNMQEAAFSNVYNLLADGGNCLLIFLGYFKPYENYRKLSFMPKWSADLENVTTKFMSPYHDSQDPENEIIRMMQRVGFRDIDVNSHHKTFKYAHGVDDFKLLMKCLNPFDSLKAKWEDFMDDYVKLDPDAGTAVYQLLVVYGAK